MESYKAAIVIQYGLSIGGQQGTCRHAFGNPFTVTTGKDTLDAETSPIADLKAATGKTMIFGDKFGHRVTMPAGGAIQILGYDY